MDGRPAAPLTRANYRLQMTTPLPNKPQAKPVTSTGHATASAWQFTPEVAAAAITLVVAVLTHVSGSGPNSLLPRTADLHGRGSRHRPRSPPVVGVALRAGEGLDAVRNLPGRHVGRSVRLRRGGALAGHPPGPGCTHRSCEVGARPRTQRRSLRPFSAGTTAYGTGWASAAPNLISIHLDSSQSNLIAFYPSRDPGQHYYAQVSARAVAGGSIGTACALIFGYENRNRFYQLAMRFDGLQLARWEGHIPARAFAGPLSLSYGNDPAQWHVLGGDARRAERDGLRR